MEGIQKHGAIVHDEVHPLFGEAGRVFSQKWNREVGQVEQDLFTICNSIFVLAKQATESGLFERTIQGQFLGNTTLYEDYVDIVSKILMSRWGIEIRETEKIPVTETTLKRRSLMSPRVAVFTGQYQISWDRSNPYINPVPRCEFKRATANDLLTGLNRARLRANEHLVSNGTSANGDYEVRIISGQDIVARSVVWSYLLTCIPFFQKLFLSSGFRDSTTPVIELQYQCSQEVLDTVLTFAYTRSIEELGQVSCEDWVEIAKVAEFLGFSDLVTLAVENLSNLINRHTFLPIAVLAGQFPPSVAEQTEPPEYGKAVTDKAFVFLNDCCVHYLSTDPSLVEHLALQGLNMGDLVQAYRVGRGLGHHELRQESLRLIKSQLAQDSTEGLKELLGVLERDSDEILKGVFFEAVQRIGVNCNDRTLSLYTRCAHSPSDDLVEDWKPDFEQAMDLLRLSRLAQFDKLGRWSEWRLVDAVDVTSIISIARGVLDERALENAHTQKIYDHCNTVLGSHDFLTHLRQGDISTDQLLMAASVGLGFENEAVRDISLQKLEELASREETFETFGKILVACRKRRDSVLKRLLKVVAEDQQKAKLLNETNKALADDFKALLVESLSWQRSRSRSLITRQATAVSE